MLELMLNIFLNSYMTSKMSIRMRTAVDAVVSVLENNIGASAASMTAVVDYYGTASTSYIIIFDEKGSVKVATSSVSNYLSGHQLPSEITSRILTGKSISEVSRFEDMFKAQVIVCGKPVKSNDTVVGGVIALLPQPQLGLLKWEIHKYFIWGMAIAIIFAFIMAYIISLQVTKPIRKINDALK